MQVIMRHAAVPACAGHVSGMPRSSRAGVVRVSVARRPSSAQELVQPQPEASAAPGTSLVQQLIVQPSTCLTALSGFALIASNIPLSSAVSASAQPADDVSISSSALQQLLPAGGAAQAASLDAADQAHTALQPVLTNPILELDDAIHQYVATHTTEAFRLMADVFISDFFITAGIFGWVACTAACLTKSPSRSAGPLAAAWALYCATCGAVGHGDPLLVDSLKHLFARARPSTLHHTFSFPSGHTSAAVFIVGGLLTVLLPLTLQLWAEQRSSSSSSDATTGAIDGNNSSSSTQSSQLAANLATDVAILAVWGAAWGTTAAGRILSESHWLSDTLAGGLLAVASVSGMACCTKLLLDASSSNSSAAATDSTKLSQDS